MSRRTTPLVVAFALLALLAPRAAQALISIEALYGIARPPSADFRSALSGAADDPDLFASSLHIAGGTVLVSLGGVQFGAVADTTFRGNSASQTAIGGLLGLRFDLGALRIDALAEAGGHRYGNFLEDPSVVTASSKEEWLFYLGLRPGIAFRFGEGTPGLLVGLWGFARWDVNEKDVAVTIASAGDTSPGSVELGGTTIGATLRVGLEF
jgi:hypothetical protein